MTDLSGFDAAYPPGDAPADQVVFGYLGGNTPHVWTRQEWALESARYRVGIWTRSNPASAAQGTTEGRAAVAAWRALGAPAGTIVVLDFETAVNPAYVAAFDAVVVGAGCKLALYGSKATVFRNPRPSGGYFVADLTNRPHLYAGTTMTQYEFEAGWDDDTVSAALIGSLWDTKPPAPVPTPVSIVPQEDDMQQIDPLSVHPGEYAFVAPAGATRLVLLADGYSAPAASLRIAIWVGDKPGVLDGVKVGGSSGVHALGHTLPTGCTGVTVHREDAEAYPVGIAFA